MRQFVAPQILAKILEWSSSSGVSFGIVLLQSTGSDFIGRMVCSIVKQDKGLD